MSALRVLVVAEEAAGAGALRRCLDHGDDVVAVVTASRADDDSRGVTVARTAAGAGIDVLPASRATEPGFAEHIRRASVDVLLNVHSLRILPAAVVAAPRIGSFNLHPGPLPGYAGLNAPSWAIYNREREHAVTLHWMDAGIDTGPIAYTRPIPLHGTDTGLTLSVRCAEQGLLLVDVLLEAARSEPASIPRQPQPPAPRRPYGREVPQGGRISWDAPAAAVDAFVRAADYAPFPSPWGRVRARLGDAEVAVLKVARTSLGRGGAAPGEVRRADDREGTVLVACADEWLLVRRVLVGDRGAPPAALLEGA